MIGKPGDQGNLAVKHEKKTFVSLLDKKEIEIVKGLFQMQISEQILPTFTIMRVIELKLISDSLGGFQNLLEKKRRGQITLADKIELGFDPQDVEIDLARNFILQIDKSICIRPKKDKIPQPILDLESKDYLVTGERRYRYC